MINTFDVWCGDWGETILFRYSCCSLIYRQNRQSLCSSVVLIYKFTNKHMLYSQGRSMVPNVVAFICWVSIVGDSVWWGCLRDFKEMRFRKSHTKHINILYFCSRSTKKKITHAVSWKISNWHGIETPKGFRGRRDIYCVLIPVVRECGSWKIKETTWKCGNLVISYRARAGTVKVLIKKLSSMQLRENWVITNNEPQIY